MTRFSKVRTVAAFEFLSTLKRMGYLVATFGMPVFVLLYGGLITGVGFVLQRSKEEPKLYGVVDRSGALALERDLENGGGEIPEGLRDALERSGRADLLSGPLAWGERSVFRAFPDEESARRALLDGRLQAYYLFPEDFLHSGRMEEYFGDTPGLNGGSGGRDTLRRLILESLLSGRLDPEVSERVREPIAEVESWTLDADGRRTPRNVGTLIARLVMPVAFTMLLFVSLMMSAGYLVQGTALEKENKVVEVILSCVSPEEILFGKLLGLAGAGLLQVAVWFGMMIGAGLVFAATLASFGVELPWMAMGVGLFLFLGGYLFLGSLMLGMGSLGSNQRESQQLSAIWTLLAVVPMMLIGVFVQEPHHPAALVMTWIPFTAPITVLLRLSLDPAGIAWWEVAGSLVVLGVSIRLALGLGARLFRVGLLLSGARPRWREIWRQARLG